MRSRDTPEVFSEVFILKDFKSCVLEEFILNRLWADFMEVRILKDLVKSREPIGAQACGTETRHGSEDPPLQGRKHRAEAPRPRRIGRVFRAETLGARRPEDKEDGAGRIRERSASRAKVTPSDICETNIGHDSRVSYLLSIVFVFTE